MAVARQLRPHLFLVIFTLAGAEDCCLQKTSGGFTYQLHSEAIESLPDSCTESCLYTRLGDDTREQWCFGPGPDAVECPGTGGLPGGGVRQITLKEDAILLCLIDKMTTSSFVDTIYCSDEGTGATAPGATPPGATTPGATTPGATTPGPAACPGPDEAGGANMTFPSTTASTTTPAAETTPSYILECADAESNKTEGCPTLILTCPDWQSPDLCENVDAVCTACPNNRNPSDTTAAVTALGTTAGTTTATTTAITTATTTAGTTITTATTTAGTTTTTYADAGTTEAGTNACINGNTGPGTTPSIARGRRKRQTSFITRPCRNLSWCPRYIGRSYYKLNKWPVCCFHPKTHQLPYCDWLKNV